jgi:cell division protein FtsW (lipid II flippase)
MLEVILGIVIVLVMGKIAGRDAKTTVIWAAISFVVCAACFVFMPYEYWRMLMAAIICLVLLSGWTVVGKERTDERPG